MARLRRIRLEVDALQRFLAGELLPNPPAKPVHEPEIVDVDFDFGCGAVDLLVKSSAFSDVPDDEPIPIHDLGMIPTVIERR